MSVANVCPYLAAVVCEYSIPVTHAFTTWCCIGKNDLQLYPQFNTTSIVKTLVETVSRCVKLTVLLTVSRFTVLLGYLCILALSQLSSTLTYRVRRLV